jgi:hypothetical protein
VSFFGRRPRKLVPEAILTSLPAFGKASLAARREGRPVTDPRFDWMSFFQPISTLMREGHRDRVIEELYEAATTARDRDWAMLGAYLLLAEIEPTLDDRRFLALSDDSLELMRTEGLTSTYLTGYEAQRWVAVHGELASSFDGRFYVGVPGDDELPAPRPLAPGASRMLALTEPLPRGNAFFAEHQLDGMYVIYSERIHSLDNPTRERCEEERLGRFTSAEDLLRALGEMFGSPPHWSDDELTPYFPERRA